MRHPFPILMNRSEVIDMAEAVRRTGRSSKTITTYCRKHGIGRQSGAGVPIEISAPALELVMHGLWEELELLRGGNRTDPRVRRIYDKLGISPLEG